jgi:hypothetical protein
MMTMTGLVLISSVVRERKRRKRRGEREGVRVEKEERGVVWKVCFVAVCFDV